MSGGRRRWVPVLVVGALAIVLVVAGQQATERVGDLVAGIGGMGWWAAPAFVAVYSAATVAFVPGSLLTLAAGALFGLGWGFALAFTGATVGSSAAFLVSRHLARPAVERRIGGDPRIARIQEAVGRQGFRIVLLLRLSPAVPFILLNYALGLTRVPFRHYLAASVGMIPGTLLYVYYGRLIGDVAALAAGQAPPRGIGYYLLLGLGLVATLAVTVVVTRTARRALRDELEAAPAAAGEPAPPRT